MIVDRNDIQKDSASLRPKWYHEKNVNIKDKIRDTSNMHANVIDYTHRRVKQCILLSLALPANDF